MLLGGRKPRQRLGECNNYRSRMARIWANPIEWRTAAVEPIRDLTFCSKRRFELEWCPPRHETLDPQHKTTQHPGAMSADQRTVGFASCSRHSRPYSSPSPYGEQSSKLQDANGANLGESIARRTAAVEPF